MHSFFSLAKRVKISWRCSEDLQICNCFQPPEDITSNCRSGFTHYVIEYKTSNSPHGTRESATTKYSSFPFYSLGDLSAGQEYDVTIRAANKDVWGDRSDVIVVRTSNDSHDEHGHELLYHRETTQLPRQTMTKEVTSSLPIGSSIDSFFRSMVSTITSLGTTIMAEEGFETSVMSTDKDIQSSSTVWAMTVMGISLTFNVVLVVIIGVLW